MLVLGALYLIIGGGVANVTACDTACDRVPAADTIAASVSVAAPAPMDTIRRRPKAVEVSEWYGRRLTIHRYVAYATIPVFGAQWIAGEQLYNKSRDAPTWAKTTHRVGATALAGMFTVNTVTGVWNWWDSRGVEQDRVVRTIHALTMLTADAAFTYAGAKLSDEAENSLSKRREHRTIAISAMGLTAASALMMKIWNR
jgi:hypothetical protein